MPHAFAQVIMAGATGLPEDVFVNTFHFDDGVNTDVLITDADTIRNTLVDFYNVTHAPGTTPIAQSISSNVSRAANAHTIKVYDWRDATPRAPVATYTWTLGAASGTTNFPNDVALCLSYEASPVSGFSQARRRGRVYIGPLTATSAVNANGDVRPSPATIAHLASGGSWLVATSALGLPWVVYSRVDDESHLIDRGWVDNAYDTQRRRGFTSTARTAWT